MGGISACIIVPLFFKYIIFKPLISVFIISVESQIVIINVLSLFSLLLTYQLFFREFEKRSVREISLGSLPMAIPVGILMGVGIVFIIATVFYSFNFSVMLGVENNSNFLSITSIMLVMSIWDELIFRAILFRILEANYNLNIALVVSSLLYAIVLSSNTNFSFLSGFVITFVFGLLTGILYSITQNLWYPVMFHLGWNMSFFFLGVNLCLLNELNACSIGTFTGTSVFDRFEVSQTKSIISIILSVLLFIGVYKNRITLRAKLML
jgi:CAAX protease family protein